MIEPRCRKDMKQIYVSAEGYVLPCCWIGNEPYITTFKEYLSGQISSLSLKHHKLSEILHSPTYRKVENSWNTDHPFSVCDHFCGAKRRPTTESDEMQGTNKTATIQLRQP